MVIPISMQSSNSAVSIYVAGFETNSCTGIGNIDGNV
jgi:hypothetical protein